MCSGGAAVEPRRSAAGARGSAPRYGFGKIRGRAASAVNMHRALCPHAGTTTVRCWAPCFSFTYLPYINPRARRVGPCAIAGQEASNP